MIHMKSLLSPKLLLIAFMAVSWQSPLHAHEEALNQAETTGSQVQNTASLAVPEPSSVLLIGTVGLMLMLRRRRLHA